MSDTYAIIAGAGSFPFHIAAESTRQGLRVVAIGLQGWADPLLAQHVAAYEEVSVGQLGQLVSRLQAHGVRRAVMAGKVTKDVLFDPRITFDAEALAVIGGVKDFSVNALLGAIGQHLASRGITLMDSSTFLKDDLCPAGVLTKRQPTSEDRQDIEAGVQAARLMARLDVGQTVVVKRRVIVAVEALEGTDAAIRRAGQVAGPGCVVVKMASPSQDMRFDLPVLGSQTITTALEALAYCLAVEAGKTLLLGRAALIAQADASGICLVGVYPEGQAP